MSPQTGRFRKQIQNAPLQAGQRSMGDAAAAATELGAELALLGLAAVKGLSDHNLDDAEAARALRERLVELGDALVPTLRRALALVESVHCAARAGVDKPNLVWTVLKEHDVDPRVLSAFVYHVTTVRRARPRGRPARAGAHRVLAWRCSAACLRTPADTRQSARYPAGGGHGAQGGER